MNRYFRAFETATMPQDTCAPHNNIEPTFRVPAVRIDRAYMELTGFEPLTSL